MENIKKIGACNTHDALAALKEEVLQHERNGAIGAAEAENLILLIGDKAVTL